MRMEESFKSLKDLLLTIVELWERNESAEVRQGGQQTREELETAGLNTNITQQYLSPHLSSSSARDPQTEQIYQKIL